jgi:hypothetical protein
MAKMDLYISGELITGSLDGKRLGKIPVSIVPREGKVTIILATPVSEIQLDLDKAKIFAECLVNTVKNITERASRGQTT